MLVLFLNNYHSLSKSQHSIHRQRVIAIDKIVLHMVTDFHFHISVELGCSANAIPFLDEACSGKPSCEYLAPNEDLYATKPCPKGFTPYLEVDYRCVKGNLPGFFLGSSMQRVNFIPCITAHLYYLKAR